MKPFASPTYSSNARILCILLVVLSILDELEMTVKGGSSQACAACKYQRRRCSKDCALAPYFPADQPKMFQNAHRLFGVSNIMKILRQLRQPHKDEAMRSIIYESNMRARFPVHGCWGIIYQLHLQVQQVMEELSHVRSQLALCKEQCHFQIPPSTSPDLSTNFHSYNNSMCQPQYLIPPENNIIYNDGLVYTDFDSYGENVVGKHMNMMHPSFYQIHQQEIDVSHEYDEIPTETIADDGPSCKEACESSTESPLKDTLVGPGSNMEYDCKSDVLSDLKSAAVCFTLSGDHIND